MAESPPRSDTPDSASGADLNAPQVVEDGEAPERLATAPAPWGGSRPWWSTEPVDGTGPQQMPMGANGTGPHTIPAAPNGSGAHPIVGGTGPHGALAGGTGPLGVLRDGTGPHGVVPDGTGPLRAVPGQAPPSTSPGGRKRLPWFVLCAGMALVAAGALVVGMFVFRLDGEAGAGRDARTTGVPASGKVIEAGGSAGGLAKDPLTPPQASAAYPFVAAAIRAAGVPVSARGEAVYGEEPARPVNVLFMGGTGPVGNPEAFLQKVQPTTFIAGQDADPGDRGGKAVCGTFAVLAEIHTFCAWATRDSYGVVASNRATLNPQFPLMADVMRRIRNDVEKPRP
ncbi:hypothetical protein [Actinomadura sp. 6K520]|uniref:hypothetical protein n=1 Tax=Actinomadura sp. 6K520 TaxID=2530364 RepID=UPI00104E3E23|nr:hypothetical protein [Actinomadura sp. 6K520]TDE25269.1 hypothetical protein E1289_26395 [Actinomadura sp. 6K520]